MLKPGEFFFFFFFFFVFKESVVYFFGGFLFCIHFGERILLRESFGIHLGVISKGNLLELLGFSRYPLIFPNFTNL